MSKVSPEQRAFITNKNQGYISEQPRLRVLESKLLSIGGEMVVLTYEEDLSKILSRGKTFNGRTAVMFEGNKSDCHHNSCVLWNVAKSRMIVYTGWALSYDGLWRQHSWVFDKSKNHIVETTEDRAKYFGFPLTNTESEDFYNENM